MIGIHIKNLSSSPSIAQQHYRMIKTSGIREKLRSNALKELAKERGAKREASTDKSANKAEESDSDEDKSAEIARLEQQKRVKRAKQSNSSLLTVLPEPKNSSSFGPTVRLDTLLVMPERADEHLADGRGRRSRSPADRLASDEMLEVDISKVVGDVTPNVVRDLTLERSEPTVVLPKGKEKQKNQITYLAQAAKVFELKHKEEAAKGRANRAAARSKYGW